MPETIGFIGLGQMGRHMAANLMSAGFPLRVYNRTRDKAGPLAKRGAIVVDRPQDVAAAGGIAVSMLANDQALESVAGKELAQRLGKGGLHISMSTVSPATSQRLAEQYVQEGAGFIAAPVFGRPESAEARKLWICVSGAPAEKHRAKAVFDALGQGVFDFGQNVGAANVVKLAGNFMLTAAIEAMAEASALAEKNGIPRKELLAMFTQTLFNCPIYTGYSKRLIEADFEKVGFALPLALKDMSLAHQTAASSRAPMPILSLLVDRYIAALANGREKLDASALGLGAAEDAGLNW